MSSTRSTTTARPGRAPVERAKSLYVAVGLALVLILGGCYSHSVAIAGSDPGGTPPPATEFEGAVAWSILWGLIEKPVPPPMNCQGQALAEVRTSSNLAYDLLAVATLGAVVPVRIDWKCARPTPETAPFPIADGSPRQPRAP